MEDSVSSETGPEDTMRRRGEENRLTLWILLEANRWTVAGVTVAVFFAGVILAAMIAPGRMNMSAGDPVETLFQGFLTATITGVSLVVSINSLVLSQELGTLGDQRERMEGAMSFRRDLEAELGRNTAPATPAAFLQLLVDALESRAERLEEAVESAAVDDQIQLYAADLRNHAATVGDDLSGRQFGTFGVLSAALDFNYSWKIQEARRLRNQLAADADNGGDDGETSTLEAATGGVGDVWARLDDIVSLLTLFGPAREHIKTLYFQWELVDLSRAMLYSAVPALIVATSMILFQDALDPLTGTTLGVNHFVWVVAAAASVALAPFAILLSFILRLGTVAKRTLSIGPFILRTTADDEAVASTPGTDEEDRDGGE
jgi:hypothetical protein